MKPPALRLARLVVLASLLAVPAARAGSATPPEAPRVPIFSNFSFPPALVRLGARDSLRILVVGDGSRVALLRADGTALAGWPVSTTTSFSGQAMVADLDGDGRGEVFAPLDRGGILRWREDGTSLELERPADAALHWANPVAGDLDGDGNLELVSVAAEGQVAVWNAKGQLAPGWPRPSGAPILAGCALAALDSPRTLRIIAGDSQGRLHAWGSNGDEAPGWPVTLPQPIRVGAAVLPFSAGFGLPIAATFEEDGWLNAFNAHGVAVPGWPAETRGLVNEPLAVGDLDGDGHPEIVVTHRLGTVAVVHADGTVDPRWPRDVRGQIPAGPSLGDLDGDGRLEILVATRDRQIWAFKADGTLVPGWPRDLAANAAGPPAVGDIDGDGRAEVVVGLTTGDLFTMETDAAPAGAARADSTGGTLRVWQNLPSRGAYENALEFHVPPGAPPVTLELLDSGGARAALLLDRQALAPGTHLITNPGRAANVRVPPGEYRARLIAGTDTTENKVLVLR